MKNFKRTFIALKITPDKTLNELIQRLKHKFEKSKIKWVNSDDFHLTLHFLGNTSPEQMRKIIEMLQQITTVYKPFNIEIKGLGAFYQKGEPSVIWVGISDNKILTKLHSDLKIALVEAGFDIENRHYAPHLTLGRVRQIEDIDVFKFVIEANRSLWIQNNTINEIYFYESVLLPSGPVYKELGVFKMKSYEL